MKICHSVILMAALFAAGCVREEAPLPKLEPGVPERSYYEPIKKHKLELRLVGDKTFECGEKGIVTFRLSNLDKKQQIEIEDWRLKDNDNLLIFCQPWLPGMKTPDPNAWTPLNEKISLRSRRNPLILLPGNMITMDRLLPFVEHLYVSPGKERRFFVKGVLNVTSVKLESPVGVVMVRGANPSAEK